MGMRIRVAAVAGLALLCAARGVAADSPATTVEALIASRAPTVVSIKYVFRWDKGETPYDASGTLVDPSGLVVLSAAYLEWGVAKARDFKVTLGNDPKQWDAVVVARDTELGVAFLQMLGLEGKSLPSLDLSAPGTVRLGQDLLCLWRDVRGFDYAPGVSRCYVTSRVEKPRALWGLGGSTVSGLFLFDEAGRPSGFTVQRTTEESSTARTFLLPLADVVKSLESAKARVPEAVRAAAVADKASPAVDDAAGKDAAPVKPPEGTK